MELEGILAQLVLDLPPGRLGRSDSAQQKVDGLRSRAVNV
jgi:hypothetical protein